jgi:N-acetylneuraminic acid mutarotase
MYEISDDAIQFRRKKYMSKSEGILTLALLAVLAICGLFACSKSVNTGNPTLSTNPTVWIAPKGGGETWVSVSNSGNDASFNYSVTISQTGNWLWAGVAGGSTPDSFIVGSHGNMDGAPRTGRVIIEATGISGSPDTIVVTQAVSPWTARQPMLTARAALAAATVNGKLYAIGGWGGENALEEYDPATNVWTSRQSLPTPRHLLTAAVVNGKLYAIGGSPTYSNDPLTTVEEYDPATNAWTTRQPLPTARTALAAAVVNGRIYAIGGWDGTGSLQSVEEYDPTANIWRTRQVMPTGRIGFAAAVMNGKIYVIGGENGSGTLSSAVEEYDPATNVWTTRRAMPTARHALAAAVVNGKIYAMGGWTGSHSNSTVEEYDPATNVWTTRQSMPTPRGHLAAVAVNDKAYAIGGAGNNSQNLDTVEKYDPVLDQ